MNSLVFVTGNANKFRSAQTILKEFDIIPVQQAVDIEEIQSEDSAVIARDKAQKAFEIVQKPLVVTDDSWEIPGLHGFPGPYMKSMNHWLTVEDWLHLTRPLIDRRIVLHQYLIYQNQELQQLFHVQLEGILLPEPKGEVAKEPSATLVSLTKDNRSIAQFRDEGKSAIATTTSAWHQLGKWLQERH